VAALGASDAHEPPPPPATQPTAQSSSGEPPARGRARDVLRHPLFAAVVVVVVAAFGGAALAHVLWPSSSSSSSSPFFRFAPNSGSGFSAGGSASGTGNGSSSASSGAGTSGGGASSLFPSTGSASSGGSGTSGLSASDASVTRRIDRGLVDIDTVLSDGEAAGTGMVVTSNGEVITNNHVINGATQITAYDVGNGRTYTARVVGYDRSQDVAVIQLENASGLTTVPLGESSTVHVGTSVVTIGNAGGVGGTPSAASGSVDALNRSITAGDSSEAGNTERLKDVIQIKGSLEPGDSGGPLVAGGKVVGMDTAASSTFSFQTSDSSAGFAIPIDEVRTIADAIVAGHSSSLIHIGATALIGVYVANASTCTNSYTGISGQGSGAAGALVCGVVSDTPAASTGLATTGTDNVYDTITGLGSSTVTSAQSLLTIMDTHHPGDHVRLTWVDGSGVSHSATVTLTSGPAD
jgi:S1-C subfamily serine protease